MEEVSRLPADFFMNDVLEVAPALIGMDLIICRDNVPGRFMITETEAYRGLEDKACHASRGETPRNRVMFGKGGRIYVYLIYGMYWMLNFVTGEEGNPQAVLIRAAGGYGGPGILTRELGIDRSFYGEDLADSDRIWVEDRGIRPSFRQGPRIGIDYAGEFWKNKPWRYYI